MRISFGLKEFQSSRGLSLSFYSGFTDFGLGVPHPLPPLQLLLRCDRVSALLDAASGLSHMHNSKPKAFHRAASSAWDSGSPSNKLKKGLLRPHLLRS